MKKTILPLLVLLGAASACQTTPSSGTTAAVAALVEPGDPLEVGRELTSQFYAGEIAWIWSRMNDEMQKGMTSASTFALVQKQVGDQLGSESEVLDETVVSQPPYQLYRRTISFSKFDQPLVMQWALDAEGKVAGFFIRPPE